MQDELMLEVNNLSYSYNSKNIFEDLQFSIKKSTINLILGTNSCGKTTLIRLLCGLLASDNNIYIDGVLLNKQNLKKYMRLFGVMFFDNSNNFLFDTVKKELEFPLKNLNYSEGEIKDRVKYVSNKLKITNILDEKVDKLSEFDQVKVLTAVSIIHSPKIVFLDGILDRLNKNEKVEVLNLLDGIKHNITVCITSSELDNILLFDNVVVLSDKKVILNDAPLKILEHDNELSRKGFYIPLMIDLSLKLKFYNLLDKIANDIDEVVDKLWN